MLLTLLATSLALQAAPPAKALQGKSRPDTIVLLDSIIKTEKRFFEQWTEAWKASEGARHPLDDDLERPSTLAGNNIMCLTNLRRPFALGEDVGLGPLLQSSVTSFTVCPSWSLGSRTEPPDERLDIDAAIDVQHRVAITSSRKLLSALIGRGARSMPANNFVIGQRIRLLVDLMQLDSAQQVVRDCKASNWWCSALAGYVFARRNDVLAADSSFAAAIRAQELPDRCRWTDARLLLANRTEADKFAKLSCAQRDSVSARLLWLADPLFIRAGNERRVEQYVRKVFLTLHAALDHDERFDWRWSVGSDVRADMVMQYGWPTYMRWGGREMDLGRDRNLGTNQNGMRPSPANGPYTTYEYSRGREHLVPTLNAILDPFHSRPEDWSAAPVPSTEMPSRVDPQWWPNEHFASPYPLAQLFAPQVAFLRRDTRVLFAAATVLDADLIARDRGTLVDSITLFVTDRDDSIERIAQTRALAGGSIVVHGLIESRSFIAGIEFPPAAGHPAGRTRFGITPPPPLSAMKPGETAISDPVLLRAPKQDADLSAEPDSALAQMAGSTRVDKAGRIGVYWETYGFKPSDTVDVAVWIERHTSQGIVRNLGITLKVATDLNTPVSIGWREPQPEHRIRVLDGPVPIISRSLILDTSQLAKGDYWLDIAVGKPGSPPVRGRRSFTVQ